jgi:hypothetical protein
MGKGKTQLYLDKNPEAKRKQIQRQAEINRRPEEKQRRAKLNAERKKRGLKGDPRDLGHTANGKLKIVNRKRNRQANGHGNNPRYT